MADEVTTSKHPHSSAEPFRPLGTPSQARTITTETCLRCGYALRGLPVDGACPECGRSIERSLRGASLRYADPRYVRRMHHGLIVVQWATGFGLTGWFVFLAAVGADLLTLVRISLFFVALCIVVSVNYVGWWMATTADPGLPGMRNRRWTRWCIRAGLAAAYLPILTIAALVVYPHPIEWVMRVVNLPDTAFFAAWMALAGLIASYIARVSYIRWLAMRLPNQLLDSHALATSWTIVIISILGAPMCLMGPLIASLLWMHLLDEVRTSLRDAADIASRSAQPPTPAEPHAPLPYASM